MRSLVAFVVVAALSVSAFAQSPKGRVTPDSPKPPLTYHGLIPGLSTAEEVRAALGDPASEAPWYAYKLLYPVQGREGIFDVVHLSGKGGVYASCEAASVPEGYETEAAIRERQGKPEFELKRSTFSLLDYSAKGLRFTVDSGGKTTGVAYVPRVRRRVHSGARRKIDLSGQRQGPQPSPEKPASLEGLRVGAAEASITPVTSAWLDPRYRDVYRPHDDLFARVVVFEKDGLTVALVGADIFAMSYSDIEPIQEKAQVFGIEHVIVAQSHTHSGPDCVGVYGHYPAEYDQYIRDQIVAAVLAAQTNLQPVKELRVASRELPMDGARVAGFIRNARNPGLVDPVMAVLQAIGADDKPVATVVNFACHPEGLEAGVVELSADFPGYMCDRIRQDGGGQPVFLNGALGGMISGDSKARTHEETEKMGLGFAAMARDLLETAQPPERFEFAAETRRVEIPVTNETFFPLFEKTRPLHDGRVVTEMSLVTIGECQMVTLPGELLPEVGLEIREKMKGFPRMLIGLANDQLGYIVPPYDYRLDSYEERMSQGPATAPIVKETAILMLEGLE